MKHIVKATKPIVLLDPNNNQIIEESPSVIQMTQFVAVRIGLGEVKILVADLPDTANNEDFKKFLAESDNDSELAIESYCAKLDHEYYDEKPSENQKVEIPVQVQAEVAVEKAPEDNQVVDTKKAK